MGTQATEVFDLFMTLVNDYRLNALYQTSGSDALNTYLEGWLLYANSEFEQVPCNQSLNYDTTTLSYTETLTQENIIILAQVLVKYWLAKEVQSILAMNLAVTDHDFKTYSQSQNITAKQQLYNNKREELDRIFTQYSYKKNSWTNWNTQLFG